MTANPETDNMFVDGLKNNVVFEDVASPVPVADGLKCSGCAELVLALAIFIFWAVVAVPAVMPYPDWWEYVAVVAVADDPDVIAYPAWCA